MTAYNRQNPFLASIKERYSLAKPGSNKNTQHIVLDLKGSGFVYEAGDSIGIFPQHDFELISRTLKAIKAEGHETVHVKHTQELMPLAEFLAQRANLSDISPKLVREIYARQKNKEKRHQLEELLKGENRDVFKQYLGEHELWDFLLSHEEVDFKPQELADLLMPLLPRFYSIASSQNWVGEEVHLTVTHLEYESRGHRRRGVCTHYLCQMVEVNDPSIPVFIQSSHGFRLPDDIHAHMIMVGPGTGVAPFRAFMQERLLHLQSKGMHWLFFGEWNRAYDFFYEEEWAHLASKGHLRVETAFSRDQQHKLYVQHKLQEYGQEIYEWLEKGAYFYVCGDAQYMAKDVEAALLVMIKEYGLKSDQETKEYIKKLRQQKRYLRDVY